MPLCDHVISMCIVYIAIRHLTMYIHGPDGSLRRLSLSRVGDDVYMMHILSAEWRLAQCEFGLLHGHCFT